MNAQVKHKIDVGKVLLRTGMVKPTRPDRALKALLALRKYGSTAAAAYVGAAARFPNAIALIDERGSLTFSEVNLRTNALARGLASAGIHTGDRVAIMCRNHRGIIEATIACTKLGVSSLYLNTAFAGPQLADVMRREQPKALIYDEEFAGLIAAGAEDCLRFVAWRDSLEEAVDGARDGDRASQEGRVGGGSAEELADASKMASSRARVGAAATEALTQPPGDAVADASGDAAAGLPGDAAAGLPGDAAAEAALHASKMASPRARGGAAFREDVTLEQLIATGSTAELPSPADRGKVIILTSGTTGTPKGAARKQPDSLEPAAALFSRIPLKARETTVIAAPIFHSWGFGHFTLALPLSSTLVLRRRFDPEDTLKAVAEHRASALVLVPVMLQRMLELPRATLERYDLSCLKVIALSGSALPGELAIKAMDVFGDVLYNLYGSTEVAWATIATPAELRAAPGTAGTAPIGTVLKLLDESGREVRKGELGRIFVGNEMVFEGYTEGGSKEMISGLMSTGDVGRLDQQGRLFVEGRDDEMIVSGGENVFPREVEDLLADHEEIEEVAVIGVEDASFGQRLKAFVVKREQSSLTAEAVQAYVKHNLARFKVPRDVVFLDALPRNATGKVLKRDLASRG